MIKIHPLSDVKSKAIGDDTSVWQFCVVFEGATVGRNCNVCSHVLIEDDVVIGDNVTVKSGVQIWNGITIENNVFIGPNVSFTNDLLPRSKNSDWERVETVIYEGASIGANATIIAGNNIGKFAMIGAGSVVTKPIGNYEIWIGNPACHIGFITIEGDLLDLEMRSKKTGNNYQFVNGSIVKKNG